MIGSVNLGTKNIPSTLKHDKSSGAVHTNAVNPPMTSKHSQRKKKSTQDMVYKPSRSDGRNVTHAASKLVRELAFCLIHCRIMFYLRRGITSTAPRYQLEAVSIEKSVCH